MYHSSHHNHNIHHNNAKSWRPDGRTVLATAVIGTKPMILPVNSGIVVPIPRASLLRMYAVFVLSYRGNSSTPHVPSSMPSVDDDGGGNDGGVPSIGPVVVIDD
uniref:Uncharacterized protein n=1 Tax=Leptocylindrus danicus TaxID=163516 RepID=A0A7S2PF44_9STRA